MCEHAQKSTALLCALAQSAPAHIRALLLGMATAPKSASVQEYRRQIAAYLKAVMIARGWKLVQTGEMAGNLKHTTISRALKMENTLSYPALLALEENSGVPIPDSLVGAARAAQQPARREEDALRQRISDVAKGLSETEKEALLETLQKALAKTG